VVVSDGVPPPDFDEMQRLAYLTDAHVDCWTAWGQYHNARERQEMAPARSARIMGFGGEYIRRPFRPKRGYSGLAAAIQDNGWVRCFSFAEAGAIAGMSEQEWRRHVEAKVEQYPERTPAGEVKRLHFDYHALVGAGEDRRRLFTWTVQPLSSAGLTVTRLNRLAATAAGVLLWACAAQATEVKFSTETTSGEGRGGNIKLGSLTMGFGLRASATWDDNVKRSADPESSLVLSQTLTNRVEWPVSPHVYIGTSVGLKHTEAIVGETDEGFDVSGLANEAVVEATAVSDLSDVTRLAFEDILAHDLDSLEVQERDNAENFSVWRNTASVLCTTEVTPRVTLSISPSRVDQWAAQSEHDDVNSTAHRAKASLAWRINPAIALKPYVSSQQTSFWQGDQRKTWRYDAGVGLELEVTECTRLAASVGYEELRLQSGGSAAAGEDSRSGGPALALGLGTRLTEHIVQDLFLSFQREDDYGAEATFSENTALSYGLHWRVHPDWSVGSRFQWQSESESSTIGENADIFATSIAAVWRCSSLARVTCSYEHTVKDSDQPLRGYRRNACVINLYYTF